MSYVASLIGINPYKNIRRETDVVLRRYNTSYGRRKVKTKSDKQEMPLLVDLKRNHTGFYEKYTTSINVSSLEIEACELMDTLCEKHKVPAFHKNLLQKTRGYRLEKISVQMFAEKHNFEYTHAPEQTVFCTLHTDEFHREKPKRGYRLIGSADALTADSVWEIKNRKSRFLYLDHENIQLAIYILVYNKPKGYLIQMLNGEFDFEIMTHEEAKKLWHRVKHSFDKWVIRNSR